MKFLWVAVCLGLSLFCSVSYADVTVAIQQPTNYTFNDTSRVLNYTLSITTPENTTGYFAAGCSYILNGNPYSIPGCINTTMAATVGFNTLAVSASFSNGTNVITNTTAVNFTVSFNFIPVPGSVTTTYLVSANLLEDTFATDNISGGCGAYISAYPPSTVFNSSTVWGNDTYVATWSSMQCGSNYYNAPINSYYKFDITPFFGNNSKILVDLRWGNFTPGAACVYPSSSSRDALYVPNSDSWSENNLNWTNRPTLLELAANGYHDWNSTDGSFIYSPIYAQTDITTDPNFAMSLYNSSNITLGFDENSNCPIQTYLYSYSKENGYYVTLNATVTDFITGSFMYPRFSYFNPNFYWNFESNSFDSTGAQSMGASSTFPAAEIVYQTDSGPLTANLLKTVGTVTAAYVRSDDNADNNLINTDCKNAGPYISGFSWNVNTLYANRYDVICFNLSSLHAGRPFYAALKILGATATGLYPGRFFAADWAMYSGDFTGFSIAIRNPAGNTISPLQNVTETWTTTQPTTTGYQYWEVIGGVPGPATNFQDTNYSTTHTFTIPDAKVLPGGVYHVLFFGTVYGGNTIASSYEDNFNVSGGTGQQGLQGQLANITNPLSGGLGGLGVELFNERGNPIGGYVSLDGGPYITTALVSCPNCSWQVTFADGTSYTIYPGSVFIAQFTPDLATIGTHNIRAKDFSGARNRTYTLNIPYQPYNFPLRVLPAGCVPQDFEFSQLSCESDFLYNFTGMNPRPTGEFCAYNPTECQLYNYSDGTCIEFARHICTGSLCAGQTVGGWVHYLCYNQVSSGYYNTTLPVGSGVPGTGGTGGQQGNVVPSLTNPLEQILGMTTEQILAMLSLIISIAVGIFAGAKTKDGMMAVVVIVCMLLLFTMVGWLPFWVAFVIAIIAAFLVARFARGMFVGGGGQ